MTVLVTGAAGYLGRHVVANLTGNDIGVLALCRGGATFSSTRAGFASADLCDETALDRLFRQYRPDSVIHCAAAIPRALTAEEEARSERDNLAATRTLLSVAARHPIRRLIFASTISVYTGDMDPAGDAFQESMAPTPEGFYGRHKLEAEILCKAWCAADAERSCVVLRYAGLHGAPRQSGVVFAFVSKALGNDSIFISAARSRYALLDVRDAAEAAFLALDRPSESGYSVFNIASAESTDLRELAEKIRTLSHSQSDIDIGGEDPRFAVMAIESAQSVLGFQPTPLDVWLKREIALLSEQK